MSGPRQCIAPHDGHISLSIASRDLVDAGKERKVDGHPAILPAIHRVDARDLCLVERPHGAVAAKNLPAAIEYVTKDTLRRFSRRIGTAIQNKAQQANEAAQYRGQWRSAIACDGAAANSVRSSGYRLAADGRRAGCFLSKTDFLAPLASTSSPGSLIANCCRPPRPTPKNGFDDAARPCRRWRRHGHGNRRGRHRRKSRGPSPNPYPAEIQSFVFGLPTEFRDTSRGPWACCLGERAPAPFVHQPGEFVQGQLEIVRQHAGFARVGVASPCAGAGDLERDHLQPATRPSQRLVAEVAHNVPPGGASGPQDVLHRETVGFKPQAPDARHEHDDRRPDRQGAKQCQEHSKTNDRSSRPSPWPPRTRPRRSPPSSRGTARTQRACGAA